MTDHKTWPVSSQKALLRATFLSGAEGLSAFETWKSQISMVDHPDLGSFRLLPCLFHHLKAQDIDDPFLMKFKGIARRNWYKNQRFFRSLAPPLQALHEAGIECMLLYGPVFALRYYTDYALSSETNLAVWVPIKQARLAIKQLQRLGWQPERRLPDALIESYLAADWMHVFRDAAGRRIHLHWHLLPECRTSQADTDFWNEAITTKVHDVPVRILNPADQILHSCVEYHSTAEPSHFLRAVDVMLIMSTTPDLDWERLLTQAEKHHLVIPLLAVLHYIQAALNQPLPPAVWQRLKSRPISRQERLEYSLKQSRPLLWRRFWQVWFDYRRCTAPVSLIQGLLAFPRYLQHLWRLPDLHRVPGQALSILHERLRHRFFYLSIFK
ncbi:MAG: nucleotidyltransferase family protein [Anaerolineales bacterium]|nr:nucleotidyltransferase family protein [Anaerolineales bacterium]